MDAITSPPAPVNEPNLTYAPGSPERETLVAELARLEKKQQSFRAVVGGRRRNGGGAEIKVVQPHDHAHVLGTLKNSTTKDAEAAIKAGTQTPAQYQAQFRYQALVDPADPFHNWGGNMWNQTWTGEWLAAARGREEQLVVHFVDQLRTALLRYVPEPLLAKGAPGRATDPHRR